MAVQDAAELFDSLKANQQDMEGAGLFSPRLLLEVEEMLARPLPEGRQYLGVWKREELVGAVELIPRRPGVGELVYWIDRGHRGQGYAASAVEATSAYAASAGYSSLIAWVDNNNLASQRTLEKAGFSAVLHNGATGTIRYSRHLKIT